MAQTLRYGYLVLISDDVIASIGNCSGGGDVGPGLLAQAVLMGTTGTPGGPTLYAGGLNPTGTDGPLPECVSRDAGRTWSPVPTAGRPQGQRTGPPLATLVDGSLMLIFTDAQLQSRASVSTASTNDSFYAWRPGDTQWFPVAPPIFTAGGSAWTQVWLASPANGPQALWIVVQAQQGTIETVRECVLQ